MRAARLIKIVLLLQSRPSMTAAELARELEVSERTVTRDAQALSEAGVPVYAERGRAGGYRLIGGYRTRLTGLARGEAEALFLSGVPGALREMGLEDAASAARLKVSAALLPSLRDASRTAAQRFHLDAPTWFREPRTPGLLPAIADAVWDDRRVTARYRRGEEEVIRDLEPYGLVLKAGVWYLCARVARGGPTTGERPHLAEAADGPSRRAEAGGEPSHRTEAGSEPSHHRTEAGSEPSHHRTEAGSEPSHHRTEAGGVRSYRADGGSRREAGGRDAADRAAGSGPGSGSEPGPGSGSEPGPGSGSEPGPGSGSEPGSGSDGKTGRNVELGPDGETASGLTTGPGDEPARGLGAGPDSETASGLTAGPDDLTTQGLTAGPGGETAGGLTAGPDDQTTQGLTAGPDGETAGGLTAGPDGEAVRGFTAGPGGEAVRDFRDGPGRGTAQHSKAGSDGETAQKLTAGPDGNAARGLGGKPGGGAFRVYRVERFVGVAVGEGRFVRDEGFDLPGFWAERAEQFARSILRDRVVVRLSAAGVRGLPRAVDPSAAREALDAAGAPDADGWVTVTLPVESEEVAHDQLRALGPEAEVLAPASLRERFARDARRLAELYAGAGPVGA